MNIKHKGHLSTSIKSYINYSTAFEQLTVSVNKQREL